MKLRIGCVAVGFLSLLLPFSLSAQTAGTPASAMVPPVIQFSNVAIDEAGSPLIGSVPITFSLYNNAQGGQALWTETQNVLLDSSGHYSVYLGITKPNGLPMSLFTTGQAHWLGVQLQGQSEQARVFLVSVPYAMKAGDAATIGGLPPSAFMLAGQGGANSQSFSQSDRGNTNNNGAPPLGGSGTQDFIPLWTDNSGDLGNSILFQSGTTKVGIGTTTPADVLDVNGNEIVRGPLQLPTTGTATSGGGFNSQPFSLQGSSFNSTSGTAIGPLFQWQTEPSGNNTSAAAGTLNLLYGNGSGSPKETGLNIASTGLISFPAGQTFPGTITSVAAGTGLSETGSGGKITLSINTTFANEFYPQLAAANTFTKSQTINGNLTLTGSGNGIVFPDGTKQTTAGAGGGTITGVTAGTDLTGGGISGNVTLNLDITKVPQLATANTFLGNQSITGNFSATGTVSGAAATFTGVVTQAGALLPASGTATAGGGFNSQPFDAVTSVFNSTGGTAQNQDFRWLAEPVGNNTSSPSGKLDLLFGANGATPTETGLSVASNGIISFAAGQTFGGGGGGTVTSVGSGLGLKGGPITTSGTLTIDTTVVPQLGAANTFTGNQTLNGTLTATASSLGVQAAATSVNGVGINALSSATTGTGAGVIGATNSPTGNGIVGTNNANSATAAGVLGQSNSPTGEGVVGTNTAATGSAAGVLGQSNSATGIGVQGTSPYFGVSGIGTSATGAGLIGYATSATGQTIGVGGTTFSSAGTGVFGVVGASTGTNFGVQGVSGSPTGYGVFGSNLATTGTAPGAYGTTSSSSGYGVEGAANAPTAFGVFGTNSATTGTAVGVYGTTASSAGVGVQGSVSSPSGYGVYGTNFVTTGSTAGVYGSTASTDGYGVEGANFATSGTAPGVSGVSNSSGGYGVQGSAPNTGIFGAGNGTSTTGSAQGGSAGVWGDTGASTSGLFAGVLGTADNNWGGFFINNSTLSTLAIDNTTTAPGGAVFSASMPNLLGFFTAATIGDPGCGETSGNMGLQLGQGGMGACSNYTLLGNLAGSTFVNANSGQTLHLRIANSDQLTVTTGTVNVNGTFTAGDKKFKIDHPLDPANKYLYHTSVESSEMMNIYTGNVITGGDALATVQLPDWFEALNKDFRYQLTVIGQFAQAIVASEISHHRFSIRTDKPNVKVSWQVTGVRHDAYTNAHRIPVEVEKASADRGRYLYPEAFGQPASARIGYEVPPPASDHVAQNRPAFPRRVSHASPIEGRGPLNFPVLSMPSLLQPAPPRTIPPQPTTPRVAPLPHPAALARKLEINQK